VSVTCQVQTQRSAGGLAGDSAHHTRPNIATARLQRSRVCGDESGDSGTGKEGPKMPYTLAPRFTGEL